MSGQNIFECLDYLDDKYIKETQEYLNTNRNRKKTHIPFHKFVAAAAVVSFVAISGAFIFLNLNLGKNSAERLVENFENELNQDTQVCINGEIYQITSLTPIGKLSSEREYIYVGVIESNVSSNLNPQNNLEANADILGSKVYQAGDMIVINAHGTKAYWTFKKSNDLVYRNYDTGFDINCDDSEEVTIYWNYNENELKKIYLYAAEKNEQKELSIEEMSNKCLTITQNGHYYLYGIDTDGKTIDLTEYLSMEYKNRTHIDGENNSEQGPIIGFIPYPSPVGDG